MIKLFCIYYSHSSLLKKCFHIFLIQSPVFRTLVFNDHFLLLPFAWLSHPALPLAFSPGVASRFPHFLHDQAENFVLEGGGKIKEEGERSGLIGVLCMILCSSYDTKRTSWLCFRVKSCHCFSHWIILYSSPQWNEEQRGLDVQVQIQQVLRVSAVASREVNFACLCPLLCRGSYCTTRCWTPSSQDDTCNT